ncbi:MAG: phosphate acyltransferase, partial [Gammaproteobacteria bacterium]|nr:phosphate acyltransferase [Gammaproteobacteria bacterium]
GFVGNVALKNTEGVAKLIRHFMAAEFKRNLLTKLSGIIALPVLKALRRRIDPRRYNGASLLGLRGIVVKSHGGADALAFRSAIAIAKKEVLADIADRIEQRVAQQLDVSKSA